MRSLHIALNGRININCTQCITNTIYVQDATGIVPTTTQAYFYIQVKEMHQNMSLSTSQNNSAQPLTEGFRS